MANASISYAKAHLDQPEIAMPAFKMGARVFPLHASFLDAPAYYAIFANMNGMLTSDVALAETANALRVHPNSVYLAIHYRRLREEGPP